MKYMPVTESMFLIAETRDQPMHVGGLQLFIPRDGQSTEELADEICERFYAATDIAPMFRKRPATPAQMAGYTAWTEDADVDFDYHIRRIILPRPGGPIQLLRYVSLNHGALLDRRRPMWEVHIIEGIDGGRVGLYTKVHHSVVDGVSALRLLQRSLSTDPDDRSGTAMWVRRTSRKSGKPTRKGLLGTLAGAAGAVVDAAGQVAGLGPAAAKVAMAGLTDRDYVAPMQMAPTTMLNQSIGSARRFAAQDWPIERLRAVAQAQEITINDVILAMCSGALRAYLDEHSDLPTESLVAVMPVSLHTEGDADGNAITAISVRLATDLDSPADRVAAIKASTTGAKNVVRGLKPLQAMALGAATIWPLAFATVPGFVEYTPRGFNLMISNVPGPEEPLYWNGAKLDGCYPVSIPMEGLAMNITVTTVAGKAGFGIIGARAQLPSLQKILVHLETALAELEALEAATP